MKIAAFGEILFDVFCDKSIIGGAPFNFSAHIRKLGAEVSLISAVGEDTLGKAALQEIHRYGISDQYVAVTEYPTGRCMVTLIEGKPSYNIIQGVAYDFIPMPDIQEHVDAFYMGTLAVRNDASKDTLQKLLHTISAREIFFDINIRQQYYSNEVLENGLQYATILKISREEMGVFGKYTVEELCQHLATKHTNLKLILLTLDKDGAYVYDSENQKGIYSKKPKNKVVSTVGAGDSFSACFMYHYLNGEEVSTCLNHAIDLSDYVVTKLEAIPD